MREERERANNRVIYSEIQFLNVVYVISDLRPLLSVSSYLIYIHIYITRIYQQNIYNFTTEVKIHTII